MVYHAVKEGHPSTYWSPENRVTLDDTNVLVMVRHPSLHRTLRARATACPKGFPACVPGLFFPLPLSANGTALLEFPASAAPVKLQLDRRPLHPLFLLFLALLGGGFALLLRDEARLITLLTLVPCGLYLSVSQGPWRGLDVVAHLQHVLRIASDGPIVPSAACWECFQPPLYYLGASAAFGFTGDLSWFAVTALQGVALLLHLLSVPLIVGALRPFARSRNDLLLYSALAALWPAAVLQSARLGNDGALNLCAFVVLFLLATGRARGAAAAAAFSLLVKKSALALVLLAGASALWRLARRRDLSPRAAGETGAILAAGLLVATLLERAKGGAPQLDDLAPPLAVANSPANLLLPHPAAFLREPFVNPWLATPGRDHLTNYFWKTSLFGEWSHQFPGAAVLATTLAVALLLLLGTALAAWWREKPALPPLALLSAFAAVAGYRALHPFACNADFRFAYPAAALGVALALCSARGGALPVAARWVTAGFLGVSQLFLALLWLSESL